MNNNITPNKDPVFKISDPTQIEQMQKVFRALASFERIKILNLIQNKPMTIKEIADIMSLPISSVTEHTKVLNEANIINIEYMPNKKGFIKLCSKSINTLKILFDDIIGEKDIEEYVYEMPVGNFSDVNIVPPCGMAGKYANIGDYDELSSFYLPNRHEAELIWFSSGNIIYKFPNPIKPNTKVDSLRFSLEICSETLYSRNDWPSDITFWVNNYELFTWTSPGDFGGRRGKYTPEYWFINSTQYGLLKNIKIDESGVYLDDILVNKVLNINNIHLHDNTFIKLKIGIKPDAIHNGGINIFGKNFGDFNQSIIMKVYKSVSN